MGQTRPCRQPAVPPVHANGRDVDHVVRAAAGHGRPLDRDLRARLESSFGRDLTAVRIHTDAAADRVTRYLGADAVAAGHQIFFRHGRYRPGTAEGLRLLAHEVAHTVQQASGLVMPEDSDTTRRLLEEHADRAAERVVQGQAVAVTRAAHSVRLPEERPVVLQRHDSYEHRALGDMSTPQIEAVAARTLGDKWYLEQQADLMDLWREDPLAVTEQQVMAAAPGVRTLRLSGSGLLVTYGELNALPDYVANPVALDSLPADVLLPLLQGLRQQCYNAYNDLRGKPTKAAFVDAPMKPGTWPLTLLDKLVETFALDKVTRGVGVGGTEHYQGLLARNACHFVPFAWHRWQSSYLMARNYARMAFEAGVGDLRDRWTHLAWVFHGYADHFLQDSFAAGHLVNKNLIMQWWIDWNLESGTVLPIEDWDLIKGMATKLQPDLAGRRLYDPTYEGPSNDPQTVEEQVTYGARLALTGVLPHDEPPGIAYQRYLAFLSSVITQATSAELHDRYNAESLWVASEQQPTPYELWGDDTLFRGKNAGEGARNTSEAAQLSQQSITDLLTGGVTDITTEQLRRRFPTKVRGAGGALLELEDWQDSLKDWVVDTIFGNWQFLAKRVATRASPLLANVSQDQDFTARWSASAITNGYPPVDTLVVGDRLFAAAAGQVRQYDPVTGDQAAFAEISTSTAPTALASDGDRLYVAQDNTVWALSLDGLLPQWRAAMPYARSAVVHLSCNRQFVYAGCNGTLARVEAVTGSTGAPVLLGAYPEEVRLVVTDQTLYAGYRGTVYAVDALSFRKIAWSAPVTGKTRGVVDVVVTGSSVYVGSNGYVMEFDASNGRQREQLRLASAVGIGDYQTRLAVTGTHLFAGCHGFLYGVALDDWSAPAWTVTMPGYFYEAVQPLFEPSRDLLYAGSNGYLVRVDPVTGSTLRSLELSTVVGKGDYTPSLALSGTHGLLVGMHGYAYNVTAFHQPAAARDLLCYSAASGSARCYAVEDGGAVRAFGPTNALPAKAFLVTQGHFQGIEAYTDVALYDYGEQLLQMYGGHGGGELTEISSRTMAPQWRLMVAGNFGGDRGYSDFLCYSWDYELGRFYRTDGAGGLNRIGEDSSWPQSWSHLLTGRFGGGTALTDMFRYDSGTGMAEFLRTPGNGTVTRIGGTLSWRAGFTHAVVGDFGGDTGYSDLLLYDHSSGYAEFLAVETPGKVRPLRTQQWKSGWTQIVGGTFGGGSGRTDLCFYDSARQDVKFYAVDGGSISQIGKSTTLPAGITTIIAGQFR